MCVKDHTIEPHVEKVKHDEVKAAKMFGAGNEDENERAHKDEEDGVRIIRKDVVEEDVHEGKGREENEGKASEDVIDTEIPVTQVPRVTEVIPVIQVARSPECERRKRSR